MQTFEQIEGIEKRKKQQQPFLHAAPGSVLISKGMVLFRITTPPNTVT